MVTPGVGAMTVRERERETTVRAAETHTQPILAARVTGACVRGNARVRNAAHAWAGALECAPQPRRRCRALCVCILFGDDGLEGRSGAH